MRRKGWLRHIIPSCRDAIQAEKQQELPQKHAAAPFVGRENKSTEICISTMIDFYWDEAPGKP